jgi:CubicO group peptidase (beta-lactamase class C family)
MKYFSSFLVILLSGAMFLSRKMKKTGAIGMQVGYLSPDGTIFTDNYGLLCHSEKQKVNDSTLFMIAFCSKLVTALAILKLYNDNKLDIDCDINRYLPFEIRNHNFPDDIITVRMLLTHTSVLKDNWDILDPLYTTETGDDSPLILHEFVENYFTSNGKYYSTNRNFLISNLAITGSTVTWGMLL